MTEFNKGHESKRKLCGYMVSLLSMFCSCFISYSQNSGQVGQFSYVYDSDSIVISCSDASQKIFYGFALDIPDLASPYFYGSIKLPLYALDEDQPIISKKPETPKEDDVDSSSWFIPDWILPEGTYNSMDYVRKYHLFHLQAGDCSDRSCKKTIQICTDDLLQDHYPGLPKVLVWGDTTEFWGKGGIFTFKDSCFDIAHNPYYLIIDTTFATMEAGTTIVDVIDIESYNEGTATESYQNALVRYGEDTILISQLKADWSDSSLSIALAEGHSVYYLNLDSISLIEGETGYWSWGPHLKMNPAGQVYIDRIISIDSFYHNSDSSYIAYYGIYAILGSGEDSVAQVNIDWNRRVLEVISSDGVTTFQNIDSVYLVAGSPGFFSWQPSRVINSIDTTIVWLESSQLQECLGGKELPLWELKRFPEVYKALYEKNTVTKIILPDGKVIYEDDTRTRAQGNSSIYNAATAFDIRFFKDRRFDYRIFDDVVLEDAMRAGWVWPEDKLESLEKFRRFYLRKFGSGKSSGLISDAFINRAIYPLPVGAQASRLVNVMFSGEDRGLYYLREKPDKYHLQKSFGIDDDFFVRMRYPNDTSMALEAMNEPSGVLSFCTNKWQAFKQYVFTQDIHERTVRDSIEKVHANDGYFMVRSIYAWFDVTDASGSFIGYDIQSGKYYEGFKDGDQSMEIERVAHNSFREMYYENRDNYLGTRARIFNRYLESDHFWNKFVNANSDLRYWLDTSRILPIFDQMTHEIRPYANVNFERWKDFLGEPDSVHLEEIWQNKRSFLTQRQGYVDQFFLEDHEVIPVSVTMRAKLDGGTDCMNRFKGKVRLNTLQTFREEPLHHYRYASLDTTGQRKVRFFVEAVGENFLRWEEYPDKPGAFWFTPAPSDSGYNFTAIFGCLETDPGIGQLRFAETVPDNATVTVDDYGRDGKDYLELHNPTSDTINLRGAYLSDKRHRLDKHRIEEDLFLAPDQRVVFFADEDSERGVYHLNFRLNKEGETVYLSYDGLSVTDSLQWGVTVPTDLSWSVCPAGNGIANATPGYGNDCPELPLSVPDPSQPGQLMVKLCPNPTSGPINITGAENTTAEVLSLSGKVLMSKYLEGYQEAMDLTGLPAGIYMIRFFREGVLQGVGKAVRI